MVTFKTSRPNNRIHILKKLSWNALFTAIVAFCIYLLESNEIDKKGNIETINAILFCIAIFLLGDFIDLATTKRLREISIDIQQRQIFFWYKTFFGKTTLETLSIDNAAIAARNTKSNAPEKLKHLTLEFSKSDKLFFEVSNDKDGFSTDTLRKIYWTAELIPLQMR